MKAPSALHKYPALYAGLRTDRVSHPKRFSLPRWTILNQGTLDEPQMCAPSTRLFSGDK
jgi:hypothetical protein